jgi:Holliday junction resolvasome RuvABC endonuclease subunit
MVSQTDGIYLYNLTLQHASQITQAVYGVFAGNKQQVSAMMAALQPGVPLPVKALY